MDEYISREAVLKHLNECKEDPLFDPDMARICFAISIFIEEMQAADVQPVKHGKWNGYTCSECNVCADYFVSGDFYFDEKPNFCPNCGARMDLKEGDAE